MVSFSYYPLYDMQKTWAAFNNSPNSNPEQSIALQVYGYKYLKQGHAKKQYLKLSIRV